jgi:hypothetical protein
MATDTPQTSKRPRPWLLVLLGVSVVALIVSRIFSGDQPATAVSTTVVSTPRVAHSNAAKVDSTGLDVKLEALSQPAPAADAPDRDPFRFKPAPPPPPPPPPPTVTVPVLPPQPVGPPPPPPIKIKLIGVVETANGKVAAFIDCGDPATGRGRATFAGREGEVIEGRYRVGRIGIESVMVSYPDGTGTVTLPLNGEAQACMAK